MTRDLLALSVLPLLTQFAWADTSQSPTTFNFNRDSLSASASLGWLGGESKELVYDPDNGGRKNSELDWKFKNITILKANLAWDLLPWLTADARGWTRISSGNSHMKDFDWEVLDQANPSEKSDSPDTRLKAANEYALSLKAWPLQWRGLKVGPTIGYQQTRFHWTAYGGSYSYENGNDVGVFEPGKGIDYKQKYSTPFIGIVSNYRWQNVEINGSFKYSNWVKAYDNDTHLLNSENFVSDHSGSEYFGAALDVGYYFSPDLKLFSQVAWNQYRESKGGARRIHLDTGLVETDNRHVTGLSNTNYNASLGLQYRF